jgi:hypothetical protein
VIHHAFHVLLDSAAKEGHGASADAFIAKPETTMTQTIVIFRGMRRQFPSQKAAYLGALEQFLIVKPDLFTDTGSACSLRKGGRGRPLFSRSRYAMTDPARIAGGVYVETNLSNREKVGLLDKLASSAGLKRERDWEWHTEHRENPKYLDGDALLAEFEALYRA